MRYGPLGWRARFPFVREGGGLWVLGLRVSGNGDGKAATGNESKVPHVTHVEYQL